MRAKNADYRSNQRKKRLIMDISDGRSVVQTKEERRFYRRKTRYNSSEG